MSLFTPKMSAIERDHVANMMKQAGECTKLVNTTVKPEVFFGRLNFFIDLMLELKKYEKYKRFSGTAPSRALADALANIDSIVDKFISRAWTKHQEKVAGMKTEKGKRSSDEKFASELLYAFNHANSYRGGDGRMAHYSGKLFGDCNYSRVKEICARCSAL